MKEELTLRKAVALLGIDCDTSKSSVNICCPVCAKSPREKKMNLNFDKHGTDVGVFRCPKCNTAGSALQFWALMRGLNQHDLPAIFKDYNSFIYKGDNYNKLKTIKKRTYEKVDVELADINTRHKTYTALLNMLTLTPIHKENLKKRGLNDATIEKNMYRSYPVTAVKEICEYLLSKGYILKGVPGFYVDDDGRWTLIPYGRHTSFLIPQRDGMGRIQGMQLRFDDPKSKKRYSTLSSVERKEGCKAKAFCHFSRGKSIKEIILTEGPLKGDIISYYTGYSVIAIQGVNSTSLLEAALDDLRIAGTQKVTIAFDMDLYTNEYVKEALEHMKEILCNKGFDYQLLLWDQEQKGLDDWLLEHESELSRG